MTAQPTRDQLRALADTVLDEGRYLGDEEEVAIAQGVRHLLDQLAATERHRDHWRSAWRQRGIKHLAAEKRATRAEAQSAIRGRAVVMYRERARQAEAERDEWKALALQERGAALDTLGQIKARDARIKAVRDIHRPKTFRSLFGSGVDITMCVACSQQYHPCPTFLATEP